MNSVTLHFGCEAIHADTASPRLLRISTIVELNTLIPFHRTPGATTSRPVLVLPAIVDLYRVFPSSPNIFRRGRALDPATPDGAAKQRRVRGSMRAPRPRVRLARLGGIMIKNGLESQEVFVRGLAAGAPDLAAAVQHEIARIMKEHGRNVLEATKAGVAQLHARGLVEAQEHALLVALVDALFAQPEHARIRELTEQVQRLLLAPHASPVTIAIGGCAARALSSRTSAPTQTIARTGLTPEQWGTAGAITGAVLGGSVGGLGGAVLGGVVGWAVGVSLGVCDAVST